MTPGSGAPDDDVVRLAVRYRPSADVLLAQVTGADADVTHKAMSRETPDADTTIEWVRRPDGVRHLVGLQVLFASARAAEGRLSPALSDDLDARLRPVVRALSLSAEASDPLVRTDVELEVPAGDLDLPDDLVAADLKPRPRTTAGTHALSVALGERARRASPEEVGAALDGLAAVIDAVPDADEGPTARLVRTLDGLGETIAAGGGLTAPGCSAAARVALRGGTPLTAAERRTLAELLHQLDDPDQWAAAIDGLGRLTARLDGKRRP